MSGINVRPAPDGPSGRVPKALLVCGILSSALWPAASEVLAAVLYRGYSPFDQAVSELTSIGAPTRGPLIVEGFIYEALVIAFGIGVWLSAQKKKALRVTGALLVAYGAVGPLWLPFPMTAREDIRPAAAMALTDAMHITLGAVDALLYLAILGFGAAAFGRRFRLYSILTIAVVLGFGAWTNSYIPAVAAGVPTPGLGVVERIMLGAFLVWVVVLAGILLRRSSEDSGAAPTAPFPRRRPGRRRTGSLPEG